jgi:dUTP pyrophosphatase
MAGESDIRVFVSVLPHGVGLPLPEYKTAGAAGCDLRAAIETELTIAPGGRTLVPTGIAVAIPEGFEGQVRMRSGLAIESGLALLNAPGTIDSDYRGEIRVLMANLAAEPATIRRGDRIAQLVIGAVVRAEWVERSELPETARGAGGFGHSGSSGPGEGA